MRALAVFIFLICGVCSSAAMASEQVHATKQVILGLSHAGRQDYAEAAKWFQLAAEQGHAGAQHLLANLYYNGQGVPQDYAAAAKWYRLAAEQGYANAQTRLGGLYDSGEGVPQDYVAAAKWYLLAAEQGHAIAQSLLGFSYYDGQGVPQDYVEAHKWFNLAAASGNKSAESARGAVASFMTPAQIAEAQKLAREWMAARSE